MDCEPLLFYQQSFEKLLNWHLLSIFRLPLDVSDGPESEWGASPASQQRLLFGHAACTQGARTGGAGGREKKQRQEQREWGCR